MGSDAAADWSDVPQDLLLLIFRRLPITDILRSAAVCTTWCSAAVELRHQRLPLLHQAPWLKIQETDRSLAIKFYSISDQRYYTIGLPFNPRQETIVGSSHGWLIIADAHSDLYLFNPITGAQLHNLPPLATLDYVHAVYDERGFLDGYEFKIEGNSQISKYPPSQVHYMCYRKVVFSSSPSGQNFVVMVVSDISAKLAFARAGDKKWTTITSDAIYEDILFHNDHFYLITGMRDITFHNNQFHLMAPTRLMDVFDLNGNRKASLCLKCPQKRVDFSYLVSGPCMDISLVSRDIIDPRQLTVYRVNGLEGDKIVELKSLENYVFFVGPNSSICLSCMELPELTPNCIYHCPVGDVGIYNVGDRSFQYMLRSKWRHMLRYKWRSPVWFIPTLE